MLRCVLLALLLAAAPFPFPVDPGLAAALGPIDPRPGSWAEYLVRTRGREDVRVRATILPAEGQRYWLELTAVGEGGIASAARVLLEGDRPSVAGIERMYVMLAGQQPIEIPLDRIRPSARPVTSRETARVRRAAGVPLWGVVKMRSSRQSVDLLASGSSGGRSVFPPGWDQGNGSESAKK